jgi:hypothetical protein
MIIVAVLVAEIVITLMDFVEEDLSRKLPPSERINHTLLAINYGAISPPFLSQAPRSAGTGFGRTRR